MCLGHQALAQAFGGQVTLNPPVHGKATTIEHDGRTIFTGLSCPLTVGRYHSLVVAPELPDCLEESARGGGVLMGLRHRELPAEGVQFHPESVLTEQGRELLANFLDGRVARLGVADVRSRWRRRAEMPNAILTRAIDALAQRRDLSADETAEVLDADHARRGLRDADRRVSDRAAHEGRDGRGAHRAGAHDARAGRARVRSIATTCSTPPARAAGAARSTCPRPPP